MGKKIFITEAQMKKFVSFILKESTDDVQLIISQLLAGGQYNVRPAYMPTPFLSTASEGKGGIDYYDDNGNTLSFDYKWSGHIVDGDEELGLPETVEIDDIKLSNPELFINATNKCFTLQEDAFTPEQIDDIKETVRYETE